MDCQSRSFSESRISLREITLVTQICERQGVCRRFGDGELERRATNPRLATCGSKPWLVSGGLLFLVAWALMTDCDAKWVVGSAGNN